MPTIAEILAARASNKTAPAAKRETLTEKLELKEAIDRIDPAGKHKPAGLVLNKELPPAPKDTAPPSLLLEPEQRSLCRTEGEAIPMVPLSADQVESRWHEALNAFESELCLMTDPKDPERGWLALRLSGQEDWPMLLKSFPLYQHPRQQKDPF